MKRIVGLLVAVLVSVAACATMANEGPGMIVTFRNCIKGKALLFDRATTSSGAQFPNPGSLAPTRDPLHGGATEGAAPDGRELPEWVEFEWTEKPYPAPSPPTDVQERRAWEGERYRMLQALPRKTAQVIVRDRIPQDVIDEVKQSNRQREPRKLAEKSLWIYFIWFESGVRFRWELRRDCCDVLRSGGDDIGA